MLTPTTQYNKLSIIMTSKPMQTSKDNQNLDMPALTIDGLIEAQVAFMQQWLRTQAEPLSMQAWQWFAAQPLNKYVSADNLQQLINDWLLNQPMTDVIRKDIRDILHTIIYHPVNDNVPLSELVDDTRSSDPCQLCW